MSGVRGGTKTRRGGAGKKQNPRRAGRGFWHEEPDDYLLSHGQSALSSAWSRFTVLFGMGRGGTDSLWSSGKEGCCVALQRNQSGKKQSFRVVRLYLTHTRHVNRCTSSGLHSRLDIRRR